MTEINWDEISADDCVYEGVIHPEHEYRTGDPECARCGAEAPANDEECE